MLILLSFPPAWIRTNSIDFKDLVAVREECGWKGAHKAAAAFWCRLALLSAGNLLLPARGFLELARVLWAQQQWRVCLHEGSAFKGVFGKVYTRVIPSICNAFWKSTSSVLFCLYVSQALIFKEKFNISLPILLPSCQMKFQITGTTCLSWSKW